MNALPTLLEITPCVPPPLQFGAINLANEPIKKIIDDALELTEQNTRPGCVISSEDNIPEGTLTLTNSLANNDQMDVRWVRLGLVNPDFGVRLIRLGGIVNETEGYKIWNEVTDADSTTVQCLDLVG